MKVNLQVCQSKGKRLSLSLQVLVRRWRAALLTRPSEVTPSSGLLATELVSEVLPVGEESMSRMEERRGGGEEERSPTRRGKT